MTVWRDRVVGIGEEDPEQILANPFNWRVHPKFQQEVIEESLDEIGWIQKPLINRVTGHLVDGHLRVQAAIRRGEKSIPVMYVELNEDEEKLALASLDPIAGLALTDGELLADLLTDITVETPALNEMLAGMRRDAEGLTLSDGAQSASGEGRSRPPSVKAVFSVSDIAEIERAISATGKVSRGEALLEICRAYAERQLDAQG